MYFKIQTFIKKYGLSIIRSYIMEYQLSDQYCNIINYLLLCIKLYRLKVSNLMQFNLIHLSYLQQLEQHLSLMPCKKNSTYKNKILHNLHMQGLMWA